MLKKTLSVVLLTGLSLFAVASTAHAADPYPDSNPVSSQVNGSAAITPVGDPQTLGFTGFAANEPTRAEADSVVTLAAVRVMVSVSKTADANGAVSYEARSDIPGTYTIYVTGYSGSVATAVLTVVPADSGSAPGSRPLSNTGMQSPLMALWISGGLLMFGIGLVVLRVTTRRKKAAQGPPAGE
jgi:hypothetical protein